MKYKIVADSSCNLFHFDYPFSSVPLKIRTEQKEYIDNENLNIKDMLNDFKNEKGKSSTSCPSSGEWLEAFEDADIIFGVTITSGLSGCFNAAMIAKQQYEEMYPDKRVYIIDSLSTGPEMVLIIEKLIELMKEEKSYIEIRNTILDYIQKTHLLFSLSSLDHFARNGRVSSALVKSASAFKIHIIGKASYEGKLEALHFCRGEKKALKKIGEEMKKLGYHQGKIIISHTDNLESANLLSSLLKEMFSINSIEIMENKGLCSYYCEKGGLLIGFES